MSRYEVELLAPAGNKEAFFGAIHAGADAVYLAGTKYGARAYADNFSEEEVLYCIRYAHLWGRKVYLTVNTLMKDTELDCLYDYILPFYKAGLDACIIQDIGAFLYIKEHFPQMELHISTQMTVTGEYGANMLKEMGATRIVPARELSLAEIRNLKEKTGLEIETFIHGAMCYSYSGQCLFSSLLGGRSGNRGRCAQPCRLPYKVKGDGCVTKECYPLSLKDMCTIEHLDDLMEAGIDSFKIEGRMKRPEYAAGVTGIYRKYIDYKKKYPEKNLMISPKDLEQLSQLYIRSEIHDGYYYKQNGRDMITLESPSYNGTNDELIEKINRDYVSAKPKKKIKAYAGFMSGEQAFLTFVCGEESVTVMGEMVSKAQNKPLEESTIKKQIAKLGDTIFEIESMEVYTDGHAFYQIKDLNFLRREAVRELENLIIQKQGFAIERLDFCVKHAKVQAAYSSETSKNHKEESAKKDWTLLLATTEQLQAYLKYKQAGNDFFGKVYLESSILKRNENDLVADNSEYYIALPHCMRKKDIPFMNQVMSYVSEKGYKGFLIRNLEEYAFLKSKGYQGEIYGDASLYIWNHKALSFWMDRMDGFTCAYELNFREYNELYDGISYEKTVYGYLPMMVTANCLMKTAFQCKHDEHIHGVELVDRYGKEFPVRIDCKSCMNVIYNSVPISLHKDLLKFAPAYQKRIMFTVEDYNQTIEVLNFFDDLERGIANTPPFGEYTTGHEKRGVE